jgi:hypothetical protein
MPSRTFSNATFGPGSSQLVAPADSAYDNLGVHVLMAWIYPASLPPEDGSFYGIFTKGFVVNGNSEDDGPLLAIFTLNGILQFWTRRSNNAGTGDGAFSYSDILAGEFPINQWHHVATRYSSVSKKYSLFLNGIEVPYASQVALSGTIFDDSTFSWQIGNSDGVISESGFEDAPFNGQIADVRIYDTLLSDADILAVSQGQTISTDAAAWWKICGTSPEHETIEQEGPGVLDAVVTAAPVSLNRPPYNFCQGAASSTQTFGSPKVMSLNKLNQINF